MFSELSPEALFVYYQIKNNKLYFTHHFGEVEGSDRLRKTTRFLDALCKSRKLPDTEFILTVHDAWNFPDKGFKTPVFTYAKHKDSAAVLFPDPLSENFARRSRKSINRAMKSSKFSWDTKKNIAFWRGGTTGEGKYTDRSWFKRYRSQLALLSNYYPDRVDAGFTSYPGVDAKVVDEMNRVIPKKNWTVHKDHLKYKYLVVPDGNTCTYPRYYLSLLSNSVAFKQDSNHIQWFYGGLTPYEHYVPVKEDFSDLPEKVLWAIDHDDEMQKISKQATAFINDHLLPKDIQGYATELIKQYAKHQDAPIEKMDGMKTVDSLKVRDK